MPITLKREHDWTVHSINIHGFFFERWCQQAVSEAEGWTLNAVNYPVEFPPPSAILVDDIGISVADNGPGIDAETVKAILEFNTLTSSRGTANLGAVGWIAAREISRPASRAPGFCGDAAPPVALFASTAITRVTERV